MLLDNKELPQPPPPTLDVKHDNLVIHIQDDAPPSYEIIAAETSPGPSVRSAEFRPLNHSRSYSNESSSVCGLTAVGTWDHHSQHSSSLDLASASTSSLYVAPVFKPSKRGWFGGKSRTLKEVREWALNQLNDLLANRNADLEECKSIMSSCYDAFHSNKLTLSTFLQEPLSQQHTFFYWSIVNRSGDATRLPPFLSTLISFGFPLSDETRDEVRHACLLMNDQPLLQSLRCHRKFMRLPTAYEMVFGDRIPIDDITVEDMPSAEPAFLVKMDIALFMKRMNFEKEVTLEFIAQRMSFSPFSWTY